MHTRCIPCRPPTIHLKQLRARVRGLYVGPGGKCRPGRPPPPPSHHVKAKPKPALLMLMIGRSVRKNDVLATWEVFLGVWKVLFSLRSLSGNDQHGVPIVLKMLLYRRARARAPVRQHHQHNWVPILAQLESHQTCLGTWFSVQAAHVLAHVQVPPTLVFTTPNTAHSENLSGFIVHCKRSSSHQQPAT